MAILERPNTGTAPPPMPLPPQAPSAGPAPLNPYRWIILVAVLTGAFLELLDTTSVNVALRQMQGNLGATSDEIAWVSTGYILSNVVVLPLTAWLSSVFGRRLYLTASILLFTFASILCGLSSSLGALIFWRIMQGAGGAALLSTAQASLREVFPKEQQGMIQSLYIVVVVIGPTLGPTFGGWITDNYSWQWIFLAKSPLGFIAAALVWRFLTDSAHQEKSKGLDWQGIGLLAIGLGSLQYVLEEGERYDWFDDLWITRLTVAAVVAISAFVFWEFSPRNTRPVVNLRVLKYRDLSAGSFLLMVSGVGVYGSVFILPQFTQSVLGFSPTQTGLLFLPGGVATIIGTMLCGRLLNGANPLVKPPILVVMGLGVFAFSQYLLGHLTPQSGTDDVQLGLILRGAGLGLLLTPVTVASLGSLKGSEIAQGAGLTNLFRQLGGSFGIAIVNTYVTNMAQHHRSDLVSDLYSGNTILSSRISGLTGHFLSDGYGLTGAHDAAVASIERLIGTQSLTMAYDDAFQLIAAISFLAIPAALLFVRRTKAPLSTAGLDAGH
ncbi:MAG: DHA2 family efflux MFS transporter permease subunit [Janthinobacterium lividum]